MSTTDAGQFAGLPHYHTFDEWWAAKRTEPADAGSLAQQAARQAWDDAQAQPGIYAWAGIRR